MDEKTAELIKDNKGILRQLTYLNEEIEKLKTWVRKIEGLPDEGNKRRKHFNGRFRW